MRKSSEDVVNLDSLMDTLTNVVGILAFIIILMQLSLADAVGRIERVKRQMQVISLTASEAIKEDLMNIITYLAEIRKVYGEITPKDSETAYDLTDVIKVKETLQEVAKDPKLLPERENLPILEEIAGLRASINRIQNLLEMDKRRKEKETSKDEPMSKLRLPERRPAPKNKVPQCFICRFGRVWPFNQEELGKRFLRTTEKVLGVKSEGKLRIPSNRFPDLVTHFSDNDIGDEYTMIQIENFPSMLMLRFEPRRRPQGELPEELKGTNSAFMRAVRAIDKEKQIIKFFVWGDSFRAYLEARQIVDELDFDVGWEPFSVNEHFRLVIGDKSGGAGTTVD